MFTGLVKEIGKVISVTSNSEGMLLTVSSVQLRPHMRIDDSVAINGVCQTIVELAETSFSVQVVHTSLEKTTLGKLKSGIEVNLELALTLSDRLGGHIVQGHVNGVGQVKKLVNMGENILLSLNLPTELRRYVVKEGSITLDGTSLTIADLEGDMVTVSLIPHTLKQTVLKNRKVGHEINIEVDIIAKYIERLLQSKSSSSFESNETMTEEWLQSKGF